MRERESASVGAVDRGALRRRKAPPHSCACCCCFVAAAPSPLAPLYHPRTHTHIHALVLVLAWTNLSVSWHRQPCRLYVLFDLSRALYLSLSLSLDLDLFDLDLSLTYH